MSHFYGSISGRARTIGTMCGDKRSGMSAHIRSWKKGIKVECEYNEHTNKNVFHVYLTGGSNKPSNKELLSTFEEDL